MNRTLVLIAALVAGAVWAGETLLGTIVVSDGGTASNRTTGTTFIVAPLTKISVQCDQAGFVLNDVPGCDAGTCIEVASKQFFTSSINASKTYTSCAYNADAGCTSVTYTGGWIAAAPASAAASMVCRVFSRNGGE